REAPDDSAFLDDVPARSVARGLQHQKRLRERKPREGRPDGNGRGPGRRVLRRWLVRRVEHRRSAVASREQQCRHPGHTPAWESLHCPPPASTFPCRKHTIPAASPPCTHCVTVRRGTDRE